MPGRVERAGLALQRLAFVPQEALVDGADGLDRDEAEVIDRESERLLPGVLATQEIAQDFHVRRPHRAAFALQFLAKEAAVEVTLHRRENLEQRFLGLGKRDRVENFLHAGCRLVGLGVEGHAGIALEVVVAQDTARTEVAGEKQPSEERVRDRGLERVVAVAEALACGLEAAEQSAVNTILGLEAAALASFLINAPGLHAADELGEFKRGADVLQRFHQTCVVISRDGFLIGQGERGIDADFGGIAHHEQRGRALIPQQPVKFRLLGGILFRNALEISRRLVLDGQDGFKFKSSPSAADEVRGVARLRVGSPLALGPVERNCRAVLQPVGWIKVVGASAHGVAWPDSSPPVGHEKLFVMRRPYPRGWDKYGGR